MSNFHIPAYLVPIGNKRYYYAINNDNNNYYLRILNKQNKLYYYNNHTAHNEITNPFIKLRVQLKLIKVPIMMKPLVAFIFDHQRYKRFKQLRRIYENQ